MQQQKTKNQRNRSEDTPAMTTTEINRKTTTRLQIGRKRELNRLQNKRHDQRKQTKATTVFMQICFMLICIFIKKTINVVLQVGGTAIIIHINEVNRDKAHLVPMI